jgi:glycosyltransferase involved in cell wall biosynthesis
VSEPSVTVVITAFEEEAFIAEAIESVLEQTYCGEVETIVVDNGSSDRSASVAAGYEEVTVLRLGENRGPAGARNAGVTAGRGELVTFLDGDDQMLAERLEIQVGHLSGNPEVGCVVGSQEIAFEEGATAPFWLGGSDERLVKGSWGGEPSDTPGLYATSMLMARRTFEASGGFDEKIAIGADDADLLLRLIESGVEVARLNDVVVRRRVHDSSLTQDAEASKTALLEVFKHRIERQRERRA